MRKATTKTGAFAAHDLKLCPLVVALPDKMPAHRRVGPLILDGAARSDNHGRWRIFGSRTGP